ncbi:biosynthetic-type acetolactate synthase large subunit [Parahaliea aestuarii]|uniref:Acetolactate synthase n=1 Tax=Parahaliea aestuarii TaxID=1852021 RepID=A0A5C8ZMC7_9GAMM|nr:biosynthetic-type acetolactate synthase large subunit [Parahaliea aestuarii]TXS89608.1 biosynthetic-type acetolactate synthase large subunit [Parahaliea aestuarii]
MSADNVTYNNTSTVHGGRLEDILPAERDQALRGAQILAVALLAEGVDTLFGYPGGANLEIFDVLQDYNIRCIRTEHEQGAVHAAQGYARATGRVGVCLATSGPGATNLVTGIADAHSDSTPIVAITGNVPSHLLGKNAFQEVDIVAITRPVTKRSYLVRRVGDIPETVREAFALAAGQRPGPVLIDIPKDIQQQYPRDPEGHYVAPRIPAVIEAPEKTAGGVEAHQLREACRLIAEARRPVIYAGGGVASQDCAALLLALAEKMACPVTMTLMGHGAFPPGHPLSLHTLGMHGARYANVAVNEADLVLALGVRFDDRVTGNVDAFIATGKIIHIDIDRTELNKNKTVTLPICADLRIALGQLLAGVGPCPTADWLAYLGQLKRDHPYRVPESDRISPQYAIALLNEVTGGDAVVSLGVGQHQMWAMQHYQSRQPRSFLSSSGFGTMGYGLPAAIGAKVACPQRQVIDIDGDGSLNMTIHELATCHRYGIGVKVVVINNQWLGMVRQWQDMIYGGHRAESDLSDPMRVKHPDEVDIYPDFPAIAAGYRVAAERVTRPGQLSAAYERMLQDPGQPYLLDVIVDAEENVYPMIPAGGSYRDIIMGPEDLVASAAASQGSNI